MSRLHIAILVLACAVELIRLCKDRSCHQNHLKPVRNFGNFSLKFLGSDDRFQQLGREGVSVLEANTVILQKTCLEKLPFYHD